MINNIESLKIALFINSEIKGSNTIIHKITSISSLMDNSISFVTNKRYKFDQSKKALIIAIDDCEIEDNSKCTFIFSSNPRLDFIKVANRFFIKNNYSKISKTAKIGSNCKIGKNVSIGDYCVINDNISIGDNTIINNHVVIESNTIIGQNCYIKSGATIGEDGFGFERDENGIPLRFPHIGNVVICDNVEIGSKTTIARGTLESTIINNNVKIDDQVHIAHNCIIKKNTIITACVEISGSVIIGENCWIGPNSSIKDGISLGDNSFVGISSNVSHNLDINEKIGNLSNLNLRNIVKIKKFLNGK